MTDLTDTEIAELKRLEEEATPGPWEYQHQSATVMAPPEYIQIAHCMSAPGCGMLHDMEEVRANARLVAAFRSALPALLAEVERRRAEDALRAPSPASTAAPLPLDPLIGRVVLGGIVDDLARDAHDETRPQGERLALVTYLARLRALAGLQAPSPAARTATTGAEDGPTLHRLLRYALVTFVDADEVDAAAHEVATALARHRNRVALALGSPHPGEGEREAPPSGDDEGALREALEEARSMIDAIRPPHNSHELGAQTWCTRCEVDQTMNRIARALAAPTPDKDESHE